MDNNQSIEATEDEIVEEFSLFDSWDDKYEYIIDMGKKLAPLDSAFKVDANKLKGCQSTVWLVSELQDGKVIYKADSDAVIVKGLISMMIRVLSNHTPEEIINAKLDFINRIGMTTHLAQTRSNGLLAMVKQMKNFAYVYQLQNQSN